jgi:CBS-domain-containing membrane protein
MPSLTAAPLQSASFPILIPGTPATRPYRLDPDAPAVLALTDFRSAPVVTAPFDATIEAALEQMKLSGARFAFVVGPERQLVGSITSYDIQGEKPMQYMLSVGCSETTCAWRDVQVENIMEPVGQWQVLAYADAVGMTVADVAALLASSGRRYVVVVESAVDTGSRQVRGLFSAARLQLLLGSGDAPAVGAVPVEHRSPSFV